MKVFNFKAIAMVALFFLSVNFATSSYASNYPQGNFNSWNKTELYFGSALADGKVKQGPCLLSSSTSTVTEAEFKCFLDNVLTPRFPYGLTWFKANGQYTDPNVSNSQVFKEDSYVVILLYPSSTDSNKKLEEIRSLYLEQMAQSSVLRVDNTNDKVSF
jgi:hypothetical protein